MGNVDDVGKAARLSQSAERAAAARVATATASPSIREAAVIAQSDKPGFGVWKN